MHKTFFCIAFVFLHLLNLAAQGETRFFAEAKPGSVAVGESITATFILENGLNNARFSPPDWELAGFKVLGSAHSSNISIQNGQKNSSTRYTFTLTPISTGQLSIPTVRIKSGDQTLQTEPILIQALPGSKDSQPPPKNSQPSRDPQKRVKTIWI